MQFIGHSLLVHHFFLRHSENFFYLVSCCEPSCILHDGSYENKSRRRTWLTIWDKVKSHGTGKN